MWWPDPRSGALTDDQQSIRRSSLRRPSSTSELPGGSYLRGSFQAGHHRVPRRWTPHVGLSLPSAIIRNRWSRHAPKGPPAAVTTEDTMTEDGTVSNLRTATDQWAIHAVTWSNQRCRHYQGNSLGLTSLANPVAPRVQVASRV